MDLSLECEIVGTPDLRHRVRHLKWFRQSFHRCAALMGTHSHVSVDIDDRRLAAAFFNWAEAFQAHKRYGRMAPRDFAVFAGGLMLQELLRQDVGRPNRPWLGEAGSAESDLVAMWPLGFLATSYCLSVLNAVAAQDFAEPFRPSAAAGDPRIWESFRENSREEPARAIGFLDLFVGNAPNWTQPHFVPARPAVRHALAANRITATLPIH